MTSRKIFFMRLGANQVPESGTINATDLPAVLNTELDSGWRVISHTVSAPDLSGDMLISLYCEYDN